MQKTVLQHAIDHIQNNIDYTPHLPDFNDGRIDAIEWLKLCLEEERAQIEQVYQDGRNDASNNDGITPADYFTSKYGKDGTQ